VFRLREGFSSSFALSQRSSNWSINCLRPPDGRSALKLVLVVAGMYDVASDQALFQSRPVHMGFAKVLSSLSMAFSAVPVEELLCGQAPLVLGVLRTLRSALRHGWRLAFPCCCWRKRARSAYRCPDVFVGFTPLPFSQQPELSWCRGSVALGRWTPTALAPLTACKAASKTAWRNIQISGGSGSAHQQAKDWAFDKDDQGQCQSGGSSQTGGKFKHWSSARALEVEPPQESVRRGLFAFLAVRCRFRCSNWAGLGVQAIKAGGWPK